MTLSSQQIDFLKSHMKDLDKGNISKVLLDYKNFDQTWFPLYEFLIKDVGIDEQVVTTALWEAAIDVRSLEIPTLSTVLSWTDEDPDVNATLGIKAYRSYEKPWWTQTPGRMEDYVVVINADGSINRYGVPVDTTGIAIRPVLNFGIKLPNFLPDPGDEFIYGGYKWKLNPRPEKFMSAIYMDKPIIEKFDAVLNTYSVSKAKSTLNHLDKEIQSKVKYK